jgi:site-specific recombinase XerD
MGRPTATADLAAGAFLYAHTFGRAVAREMPTDVGQASLGHASWQTTSMYVRAERERMVEAAARHHADEAE